MKCLYCPSVDGYYGDDNAQEMEKS